MNSSELQQLLRGDCLRFILRPAARFCLRHGSSFQRFVQVAKIVFVEVAEEELLKSTDKVNVSRLSVATGIDRKEITRLRELGQLDTEDESMSVLQRVIGQWEQNPQFRNKSGSPKVLKYRGENNEFEELVGLISKHINPGTVLFELERAGLAERSTRGLKLSTRVHRRQLNPRDGFQLLGREIESMTGAIEENILQPAEIRNLHIRTEYDNIFQKDLPTVREWLREEGKAFHKRARDFLSKFDRDVNPSQGAQEEEAGVKVVLTAFSQTLPPE